MTDKVGLVSLATKMMSMISEWREPAARPDSDRAAARCIRCSRAFGGLGSSRLCWRLQGSVQRPPASRKRRACVRGRRRGFTLVELLVVVGIIAILVAMLLPALNHAKEAAYTATCQSNLHQWGIGLRMYVDDHDGYPVDVEELASGWDTNHWFERLQPYSGGKWPQWNGADQQYEPLESIAVCPAYARLPAPACYENALTMNPLVIVFGSYGYNGDSSESGAWWGESLIRNWQYPSTHPDYPVRGSGVVNPSGMIAIADANIIKWGYGDNTVWNPRANETGPCGVAGLHMLSPTLGAQAGILLAGASVQPGIHNDLDHDIPFNMAMSRDRHDGGFNVLFCDGHVELLKPQRLFDWREDEVLKHWNRDNLPHRNSFRAPPP